LALALTRTSCGWNLMSQLDYSTLDDETLVRLIVQARAEALSELYDRYSRLVFSLALNSVGNPATAEEITQDVFLRVWQRARQYRAGRAKVSTWLTSITRHRAIDQLRRRGSRPEQHSVTWAELAPGTEPSVNGPEEATALAIESARVRAAMAQLPEEQKQVLALAYFQGLSQSQIAETLTLPLGTVKTRIRLGMQRLRDQLQEDRIAG
jgi:RNA polymerase sigma-70 factor (ECF subfamily)